MKIKTIILWACVLLFIFACLEISGKSRQDNLSKIPVSQPEQEVEQTVSETKVQAPVQNIEEDEFEPEFDNTNIPKVPSARSSCKPRDCALVLNGFCYSKIFPIVPLSSQECKEKKTFLGIPECRSGDNYWAGVINECGGVQCLPTPENLRDLAEYLYGVKVGLYDSRGSFSRINIAEAKKLGIERDTALFTTAVSEPERKPYGLMMYSRDFFDTATHSHPFGVNVFLGSNDNELFQGMCVFPVAKSKIH